MLRCFPLFLAFWLVSFPSSASARELSMALKIPKTVDAAWLRSNVEKRLRAEMLSQGHSVQSSVSKGFHLVYTVSLEEQGGKDEAPSCVVLFQLRIVSRPENREVMSVTASGRSNYSQPTVMDTEKRRNLRNKAIQYGSKAIVDYLGQAFQKIDDAVSRLGKGQVLGKKVGGSAVRSSGGASGAARPTGVAGKPLPGRPPLRRLSAPALEHEGTRPPPTFEE